MSCKIYALAIGGFLASGVAAHSALFLKPPTRGIVIQKIESGYLASVSGKKVKVKNEWLVTQGVTKRGDEIAFYDPKNPLKEVEVDVSKFTITQNTDGSITLVPKAQPK